MGRVIPVAIGAAAAVRREVIGGVVVVMCSQVAKCDYGWGRTAGVSRIFRRRDIGGDNVALVASYCVVRWRRMQVVGVGAHTGMLRVCVSFEISGRAAARIGTVAAVAGQAGCIDLTIDV